MKRPSLVPLTQFVVVGLLLGLMNPLAAVAVESTSDVVVGDSVLSECIAEKTGGKLTEEVLADIRELKCEAPGPDPHGVDDVAGLEKLENLRSLELVNFTFPKVRVGDVEEPVTLPAWDELDSLTIRGAKSLPAVFDFPELSELRLLDGTFETVPSLDKLPKLRLVDVTGSELDSSALIGLADGAEVIGTTDEQLNRESPEASPEQDDATGATSGSEDVQAEPTPVGKVKKTGKSAASAPQVLAAGPFDTGTPADSDIMPDGPLKSCVTRTWDPVTRPATYANTKTVTSAITINASCSGLDTSEPFDDWTGANFMSGMTTLTVTGFADVETPVNGLGDLLPQLKNLYLTNGGMTKLPNLGQLPELILLSATGNKLTEVSGLTGLPKLATLTLTNNEITKLESLGGLPSLATITATNNQISSLSNLGTLPTLKTLTVTNNLLEDIEGLTGMPQLTTLTLSTNKFAQVPLSLNLPALATLNLTSNELTVLRIPNLAGLPALKTLTLTSNRIADISAAPDAPSTLTVTATNQTIAGPTIAAVQPQPLGDLVTLPLASDTVPWRAGTDNMAAVNLDTGKYAAARAGQWTLTWTAKAFGKVNYGGSVTGIALGSDEIGISAVAPGITIEGQDAVFTASVNTPAGVEPELQWYRGTSAANVAPVAGETGTTFTIPAVQRSDNAAFVKVVAKTAGGEFQSANVQLAVQPIIADTGLANCMDGYFPNGYGITDLRSLNPVDCSGQGIESIEELPLFGVGVPVDFSDNRITDISPLVTATGTLLRTSAVTNLSGNLISDVTPLGRSTVVLRLAQINLDRNRISDVSSMSAVTSLPTSTARGMTVLDQRVTVPGVDVDEAVALPEAKIPGGSAAALTLDGSSLPGPTVSFGTQGVHKLEWDVPQTSGVTFSGAFLVPVDMGTSILANPNPATGGHSVSAEAYGFVPGETVTVTWADGGVLLEAEADSGGGLAWNFTAPYTTAEKTLIATGESGRTAQFVLSIVNDEVVNIPDPALKSCINGVLRLPADAVTYRTRTDRISGAFRCGASSVKDLTGVENLRVTTLELGGNQITSLDTLASLDPVTTSLNLSGNQIADLGGLAPQPTLRTLNLSDNQIGDFSGLADMGLAANASVVALGQTLEHPVQLLGVPGAAPVVPVMNTGFADINLPDGVVTNSDGKLQWPESGEFEIAFDHSQSADAAASPPLPAVKISGVINVQVMDRGGLKAMVNPGSVVPTQRVNIVATGFEPGERVLVTMLSRVLHKGELRADEWGIVRLDDVVIARETKPGKHWVEVYGMTSESTARVKLEVKSYPTENVPGDTVIVELDPPKSDPKDDKVPPVNTVVKVDPTVTQTGSQGVGGAKKVNGSKKNDDSGKKKGKETEDDMSSPQVNTVVPQVSPPTEVDKGLTTVGWTLLAILLLATGLGAAVMAGLGRKGRAA